LVERVGRHYVFETALFLPGGTHSLDACFNKSVSFLSLEREHTLDNHNGHALLSRRFANIKALAVPEALRRSGIRG